MRSSAKMRQRTRTEAIPHIQQRSCASEDFFVIALASHSQGVCDTSNVMREDTDLDLGVRPRGAAYVMLVYNVSWLGRAVHYVFTL